MTVTPELGLAQIVSLVLAPDSLAVLLRFLVHIKNIEQWEAGVAGDEAGA